MYASVRRYRLGAGSMDDLMHRVDRDFAEAIAQEPGFVAYQAIDTGHDTITSITIFRREDQAEASNQLAAGWVREELSDFALERTHVLGGQVMVSRAAAEVLEPAHH